jgi:putative ABC transport system permease protein
LDEQSNTPTLFFRFFRWYCHPKLVERIEGDLCEVYYERVERIGKRKADIKFIIDVLLLFRPRIIKPMEGHQHLNNYGMIKSYFTIGWRNLLRNKGYSFINILGLAVGMAACLFIVQHVRFENSYDEFHEQSDNIYRVTMDRYVNGNFKFKSAKTYPAIAPRLKEDFPEIVQYVRLLPDRGIIALEDTDQRYFEDKILLADASFFKVFSFVLLSGEVDHVLESPNTIALSYSTSIKYFGNEEAVGKILNFYKDDGTQETYKVTGVFEDAPTNSHFQFDMLVSYSTLLLRYGNNNPAWRPSEDSWQVDDYYTYVLLDKGAQPSNLEEKFPSFINRYKGELFEAKNVREELYLQPIRKIHLYSDLQSEIGPTGNYRFVYYLSLIAGFIIVIAWINYVNLTTAKAAGRAKEVGVRKVFGSKRKQLITQFMFESIITNAIAFVSSLVLYQASLSIFQTFSGFALANTFSEVLFIAIVLSLTGMVLSSVYPALVLSGFKPMVALKGVFVMPARGIELRKSLVLFQFVTAILMITGLLTIRQQINFMKTRELGFDKEKLVVVRAAAYLKVGTEAAYEKASIAFKNRLLQHRQISNVTESGFVPGQEIAWRQGMVRRVVSEPGTVDTYHVFAVDERFFATYNMDVVAGKVFTDTFNTKHAIVVNETAAHRLGFAKAEDALGEEIYVDIDGSNKGRIVGVIKNYHHLSLKDDFQPQLFFYRAATWSYFTVKVAGENLPEEINIIKKEFTAAFPSNPFDFAFLDQFFDAQYQTDQRFEKIFGLFSLLAIFISCLGLFGLSSYTIIQRTKEIGIRKVLGASIGNIIALLSKDSMKLVLMAGVITLPVAYLSID